MGRYLARARLALLALALGALLAAPALAADAAPDLSLRLWPNPSAARRGDVVRYDVTLKNEGSGKASRVRVTVPLPKGQLAFVKVELRERTTWVMDLTDERIVIMFGTLRAGEERDASVFVRVADGAGAGGQPVRVRASVRYDESDGAALRSNETQLRVEGAEADTAPGVSVAPAAGPPGTTFRFTARNYFPKEKIFTWINAPGGVLPSKLSAVASEQGGAELDLDTASLAPGSYSLVVYGDSSKVTTVAPFEIRKP